jgi:hypothetical protein
MKNECRRCGECEGQDHHWLDELWFDPRLSPTADPVGDKVCKHCPAVGLTCEECEGEGVLNGYTEGGLVYDDDCPACKGKGINVVPGVFTPADDN